MSKLACNIVSYRPDPDMLAARFRPCHVEGLLHQAATLIDRCLDDFREYSSLNYDWHRFYADLETQEKQLDLDKRREPEGAFVEETRAAHGRENDDESEVMTFAHTTEEKRTEIRLAMAEASYRKSCLELRAEAVQRKKELSAPGRPFALDEQRDLTLKRLCRDYEEAVNRACVAEEGLKKVFGQVGVASPLPPEAETLGTSITNLSIWIRNCTEWLVGYQQLEQSFTRVISVRSLLNRSAWVQLKQARDSFSIRLQVPVELFRGYDNCRLKGVGAALIGEAGKVPWSISLRLPEEAVYVRAGQQVEVDQTTLPACLLGRVENRRSIHPVEICGATSLINASPLGRLAPGGMWSLDIFKPAGANSESFGHLEDVVLEIYTAGAPQRGVGWSL